MDIDPLSLKNSFEKAVAKVDFLRRLANNRQLWVVSSVDRTCPIPTEDEAETAQHQEELLALLHYARIGLYASHGKLQPSG